LFHDYRAGLRRQSGASRDLGFGEASIPADQRKNQTLIVKFDTGLVCTAARIYGSRKDQRRWGITHILRFSSTGWWFGCGWGQTSTDCQRPERVDLAGG